jgi:hypothetical protein
MALVAYPAGLTYKPDLNAFRVLEAHRKGRWSEFEDGPPLGRRSGFGRRARLAYRIPFRTSAEYDRFKAFVEFDLADGTQRFTMPVWVPKTNTYVVKTVMIEEGEHTADPWGLGFTAIFVLIVFDW